MMTVRNASSQPVLVECGGKSALLYHRKRDMDAVKEAEDRGYFIAVNQEFLEAFLSRNEERKAGEKEFESVRLLALNCLRIRHLDGLATTCSNLTVLLLADNFIARIDALASCSQLLKLDLHGNQITNLPDSSFWKGFQCLRILHLHDNPIGRYRTIDGLSVCHSLMLLTLSDTPISVRRFYRHHVINTIWSLKSLDRYVVSDEEIIEGARFGGRFAAQSSAFQLPPASVSSKPVAESADEAEASVWRLTGRVNSILAHHSPVLIIQRYWRGYLTRQAIQWAVETELWAVVTIQRRYREWKAGRGGKRSFIIHRLSTTSMTTNSFSSDRNAGTPLSGKFDYDSYLMSRRSLSSAFCRFSPLPGTRARPPSADIENDENLPNETISFDLVKLEMNIDEQLAKEYLENDDSSEQTTRKGKSTNSRCSAQRNQLQLTRSTPLKPRKIKSVREFFGPVVTSENHDDGDSPLAKFRLCGFREEVRVCDPREEIVEEKQSCARFIRLSDEVNHIAANSQPKPTVSRVPLADVRERENRKYRGAIWLTCLHAVGKDYKRAEAAERAAQQAAYVRRLKETRDGARDRIHSQATDQQRKSAIISHIEQQGLFDDLQDQQTRDSQVALRYNVVRRQSAQFEKVRRYEAAFARDFIGRTASCTKADFRFGEQEMREQRARMKRELVSGLRDRTADVRDMRRMHMDGRRNHVQCDSLAEKDELRKRMMMEMQDRIELAQSRVAELRRSKTDVGERRSKAVLVLPIVSNPHGPAHRSHTCDPLDAR